MAEVCHQGGTHKFAFEHEATSHAEGVITVCFDKTPLRNFIDLEKGKVIYEDTKEEVK
jgi:hypothetical protein